MVDRVNGDNYLMHMLDNSMHNRRPGLVSDDKTLQAIKSNSLKSRHHSVAVTLTPTGHALADRKASHGMGPGHQFNLDNS